MRRFVFVRARIKGTQAEFLRPVIYNQGEAAPRRAYVPGDGLNRVQYTYMPENEVEFFVDPSRSAAFIREVQAADRDESAPLELITEEGETLEAIPWGVEADRSPVVIHAQPNDGRW